MTNSDLAAARGRLRYNGASTIREPTAMLHRHLNHQEWTLAAIDDVIARGSQPDWYVLRQAVLADRALRERVLQICRAHGSDPYAQRHHFWMHYAQKQPA
jgi:hypothetical protein